MSLSKSLSRSLSRSLSTGLTGDGLDPDFIAYLLSTGDQYLTSDLEVYKVRIP